MQLTPRTKIDVLIKTYPFIIDSLIELSPKFKLLKNPVARKTVGHVATLSQAAAIGGVDINMMLNTLARAIEEKTDTRVDTVSGGAAVEALTDADARQEVLKDIIRDLHNGADVTEVKHRFEQLIQDVDASEISRMEQKLIDEGMPEEEVKRLCDVHVQVFKEALEEKQALTAPQGHPVHTFMLENRASEDLMDNIERIVTSLGASPAHKEFESRRIELSDLVTELRKIDLHYLRKENQLFPLLEKHDVSGPSQVMWSLHDDIRGMLKNAEALLEKDDSSSFVSAAKVFVQTIRDMIYKEEHILFPLALETLSDEDWGVVRHGEEEIGYAWVTPAGEWRGKVAQMEKQKPTHAEDELSLDTGRMTLKQISLMLKHLPVETSFVDENDKVRYYSGHPERIFPRSPGVIGRSVQKCHPPKSLHVVQNILDDFRKGVRDSAEFWIQLHGKFVYIRYFAVRDEQENYNGCVEVTEEVSKIRALEGEKRMLD